MCRAESDNNSEKDEDEEEEGSLSESESDEDVETNDDDSQGQSDEEEEQTVGLKSLLEDLSADKSSNDSTMGGGQTNNERNEMDDVAALAESIQPKGNTLLTTSVSFIIIVVVK